MLQEATQTDAAASRFADPDQLSLAAIRSAIPADTLLVEYFRVRDRILVCLVRAGNTRDSSRHVGKPGGRVLRLLQFQLSKFRLDPQVSRDLQGFAGAVHPGALDGALSTN